MNSTATATEETAEEIITMGLAVHADITADDAKSYPGVEELLPVVENFGLAAVLRMVRDAAHGAVDAHGEKSKAGASALRFARHLEKAIKEIE